MKIYIVWDNGDYGSTMSPEHDSISAIYDSKSVADAKVDRLNDGRAKWRTKARVEAWEVK